jgi:hypothetical protein
MCPLATLKYRYSIGKTISTIEMTEHYAHLAPSARKEAVARLDE